MLIRWHARSTAGLCQETPPSALSVDDLPGRTDVVRLSLIVCVEFCDASFGGIA